MRYEHFRALIENPISADSLLLVCSTIAQGSVPDSVQAVICIQTYCSTKIRRGCATNSNRRML